MRLGIAAIAALLLVAPLGCSKSNLSTARQEGTTTGAATTAQTVEPVATTEMIDGEIEGTWQADLSSLAPDGMTEAFVSQESLEIKFQPDGRYVAHASFLGQGTDLGGTWKCLKSEGNVRVLEMKLDNQAASQEVRITLVDPDQMRLAPPAGAPTSAALSFMRIEPNCQ